LKASVQLLTGCVALGLTLPATLCQAALPEAQAWATAAASAGQLGGATDSRRQADDLLRQARKAIKDGDLAAAGGLITRAEKLGVKYDPLTARFVDTPEKLRKLLDEAKSRPGAAQLPSSRFPSLLQSPGARPLAAALPTDPFNAIPRTGDPASDLTAGEKSKAQSHLKDARAALAAGDKLAALAAWQKAAAIPAEYGVNEDSPQKMAFDLTRAGIDPSQLKPAAGPATSPDQLKPSDIPPGDSLPSLGGSPYAPPALAAPQNVSPYSLPAESNPLTASPAAGAYAPPADSVYAPVAPSEAAGEEPRRLPTGDTAKKGEAARMLAQARMALDRGDIKAAQAVAQQALDLNVPDEAFGPGETRPWQVMLEIEKVARRREGVTLAGGGQAAAEPRYPVAQGLYNPSLDNTQLVQASSSQGRNEPTPAGAPSPGMRLYDEGLKALETQDRETALAKFSEAWRFQDQLDPAIRQQLKDKLTFLRAATAQPLPAAGEAPSPLEQVNSQQEVLRQKIYREIIAEEKAAKDLAQRDPRGALANLVKLRERVSGAEVEPAAKKQLLTIVDRMVHELSSYIEQNKATIEADERNNTVRASVVRDQELTIETQNKLAEMVERFNKLMDEQRYPEAEIVARQARDIDPQNIIVVNMVEKARFAIRIAEQNSIKDNAERAVYGALTDVERAKIQNVGDDNPLVFDAKRWGDLTKLRKGILGEGRVLTPAEQEIQKSLGKLVEAKFNERPLGEVLETLSKMVGVNIHLDPQGLAAEGLTTDQPVSLNLAQPISLRSALNLLLENKGLGYMIQNEVLLVTSAQNKDKNTLTQVYYVADLVMPIPNFVPGYNVGLPAALRESLSALGYGGAGRPMFSGPLTIAQNEEQKVQTGAVPSSYLAQMAANPGMQNTAGIRMPGLGGPGGPGGPGGMGGGVQADFDSLIDLITTTIAPESWVDVGGPGSIKEFATNLSLVVSQTQDVHEQIADLLQQLRRLQDLQVTIEVRFITLSDRFFERIGVDFDFRIDDNTHLNTQLDQLPANTATGISPATALQGAFFDDDNYSVGIGWTATGPTADLDIALNQGSFASTAPQFGGFDANTAANFGFAILSDIEAFFLLEAAQGDDRTNILQAPKVTLFNGQSANVNDQVTRPFVTSVIPVVGDFAAAYQPVIVVLNEGTALNVQAVVSADRRFVRLTLVPFFSQIGDVETFTFDGKVTTDSGTVVQDPSDPDNNVTQNSTRTIEGTTVQLPTFAFTSVTTTVSVPDGGTVLLGGVKRLREGRNERGVPLLSKMPWVSRLFKNVGIGRDAQSLMMMVTPRIIIQEEEEEKLGIEIEQ
jgi:general secretion pathway protein D